VVPHTEGVQIRISDCLFAKKAIPTVKWDSTCALAIGTPQMTLLALWVAGSCHALAAISYKPSPTGEKHTWVVGVCHQAVVLNCGSRSFTSYQDSRARQIVVPVSLFSQPGYAAS
jgi:hypothetical protein